MINDFLNDAILANRLIYTEIRNGFRPQWQKEFEIGAGGDRSSGIDLFAEEIFIKYLSKYGKIDSEESGIIGSGKKSIILDPIDGSSNALSHFSYYGSSIALLDEEKNVEIAIVANFASGEIFYKTNNSKLMVGYLDNNIDSFKEEKIVQNSKIGLFEKAYSNYNVVKLLNENGFKFRTPGALALSLAYAKRVDWVLYIGRIRNYDIQASIFMCEGLKIIIENDYILVSKDKKIAETINNIVKVAK